MSKEEKWMPVEEAIEHIMRVTGCSRRSARKKLARSIKKDGLPLKKEWKPFEVLPGEEAAQRMEEEPETVLITLGDLMVTYSFTPEELSSELRSGRLIACASESALLHTEMSKRPDGRGEVDPFEYGVRGDDLKRWLYNPKTPEYLLAKIKAIKVN